MPSLQRNGFGFQPDRRSVRHYAGVIDVPDYVKPVFIKATDFPAFDHDADDVLIRINSKMRGILICCVCWLARVVVLRMGRGAK